MANDTLTGEEVKRMAAEYCAVCQFKFDEWQQPPDAQVLRWMMSEVAEYAEALAAFRATGQRNEAPLFKEASDVIYLLAQIGSPDLHRAAAHSIDIPGRYSPFANPIASEVYLEVHRDNLWCIKTAILGPDGKVEKAKDYDKSVLMRKIEEIVK